MSLRSGTRWCFRAHPRDAAAELQSVPKKIQRPTRYRVAVLTHHTPVNCYGPKGEILLAREKKS